jgi:hypothetical protein
MRHIESISHLKKVRIIMSRMAITFCGKSDDFPYISNVRFNLILFIDNERSSQNETQLEMDFWDRTDTGCAIRAAVCLAIIYALWGVWHDARLRLWNAHADDGLWLEHDTLWDVIDVAHSAWHISFDHLGHNLVGETTDHENFIVLESLMTTPFWMERGCFLFNRQ